uniref:E3 ubiquitin-protein ligase TRIM39-like n=1 Tax=Fundulus heteroclitus TaxID=8078 RepID=A0A3Q2NSH7_FUNHE
PPPSIPPPLLYFLYIYSKMLPEKQLQCSVCQQVFTDPVTTPCGHNFCQACIGQAWDRGDACQCPACDKRFPSRPEMSINTALKELADPLRQMAARPPASAPAAAKPGEVACDVCAVASLQVRALKSCLVCLTSFCDAHLEPHRRVATLKLHKLLEPVTDLQDRMCKKHERLLEMFCIEDRTCVCQFCTETEHKGHRAVTIEDESKERKASDSLFTSLIHSTKERQAEANAEIEAKQRAEEKRAEELIDELQLEIAELQRRSAELKELEDTDDHLHLLQVSINQTLVMDVRRTLSRLAHTLKKDLDKNVLARVSTVDVVLDPDTAHPNIVLSSDGKQASRGEVPHVVPDNPQRFDPVICVVGKKGFLSGRIYFQVAVGNKTFWDLGVVRESINRKGMITSTPDNGYWTVRLRNGNEYRALDSPSKLLHLQHKPKTVGVFVDYEEGTVSFFDVDARSHIHTFTGCLFSERIFPFFSPGVLDGGKNTEPLIITAVSPED